MYRRQLEHEARLISHGHQLFVAALAEKWQAFCRLFRRPAAKRDRSEPPLNLMI
jgi:hypothetical protein